MFVDCLVLVLWCADFGCWFVGVSCVGVLLLVGCGG